MYSNWMFLVILFPVRTLPPTRNEGGAVNTSEFVAQSPIRDTPPINWTSDSKCLMKASGVAGNNPACAFWRRRLDPDTLFLPCCLAIPSWT